MVSTIVLKTPPTKELNLKWDQPDSTFEIKQVDAPELADGELRVKVVMLSNDPTQRGWISAGQDPKRAYVPPVEAGQTMRSLGVGQVVESKSDSYKVGDYVSSWLGWGEEVVIKAAQVSTKVDTLLPIELFLSSIGLTGLTAYFGLQKVGLLQEGQTILISAASGATGSMAVQLAKHVFKASKVIGIAGSEDKAKWVESLGADYCANYREADYKEKLAKYIGDDFVDVYFDNVGGEILDFALSKVKPHGRVIACGAIAGYNDPLKMAVNRWAEIIVNRLTVQGFIVVDYASEFAKAVGEIVAAIKDGRIKSSEGASVVDLSGDETPLSKVPETWFKLFTEEKPRGKLLTRLAK